MTPNLEIKSMSLSDSLLFNRTEFSLEPTGYRERALAKQIQYEFMAENFSESEEEKDVQVNAQFKREKSKCVNLGLEW